MGRHIQIIELNGVSSEVAHIYHPYGSLIQAYKDIFTHIKELWQLIVSG